MINTQGGLVTWWLARLPHTSRVGGSIPASAVCVEFACSPRASGVSSGPEQESEVIMDTVPCLHLSSFDDSMPMTASNSCSWLTGVEHDVVICCYSSSTAMFNV
ncbi:hypothetical protein QTP70_021564, partial [Hemibagrus guttatus]